jgi:hypothetical protein
MVNKQAILGPDPMSAPQTKCIVRRRDWERDIGPGLSGTFNLVLRS